MFNIAKTFVKYIPLHMKLKKNFKGRQKTKQKQTKKTEKMMRISEKPGSRCCFNMKRVYHTDGCCMDRIGHNRISFIHMVWYSGGGGN